MLYSVNKEGAFSIAFNSTGNVLAVGTTNSVNLIDTATGEEFARLPHPGSVNGLSFSADENILGSASSRFVQIWDISKITLIKKDSLVEIACSRMIANFDESQWVEFFGNKEFHRLCENLP